MSRVIPVLRLLPLIALPLVAACGDVDDDPGAPGARGPVALTTWSDGEVAGDLPVYVADADGALRGAYRSGDDGRLTVEVGDGGFVTVVDDRGGLRLVDTLGDVHPGDVLDLGRRRRGDGARPRELAVAPLAAVPGASYAIEVCGPTITRTVVLEPGAALTAYYGGAALDDDGGALLIARAEGVAPARFAVIDADDVAALAAPVEFGAWRQTAAEARFFVATPAGADEVEVAIRGPHGCTLGGGAGTGAEVVARFLPDQRPAAVTATAWYAPADGDDVGADGTALVRRRFAGVDLDDGALDLSDPPARIDRVAVQVTPTAMEVTWRSTGDDLGDGVQLSIGVGADTRWTLLIPEGAPRLRLPEVPEVPPTTPTWVDVTRLDVDDVDGFAALRARAGTALDAAPGWSSTGRW
ncbi:MAG: hypothetical protein H6709_04675 [Kofleriaceae bacterium]|nr:hypothetical protein [Kofleriaceae bacterium]MCB9571364.1 hypothetical protein [Kofleriaceae bacterium]